MYQIDRLDVFIGLLTGSSALCKVFSSRFKAGELSFIFIFTWVKQADFEKVICLRYILSCASAMQAHSRTTKVLRKQSANTLQADNANTCEAQSSQLVACTCAWARAGGRRAAQLQNEITHVWVCRLHELNNPRLGKNCRGKWNFPTRGGKKRRRANPPACLGPTMSGRKNGYKKIKGCRVGGC